MKKLSNILQAQERLHSQSFAPASPVTRKWLPVPTDLSVLILRSMAGGDVKTYTDLVRKMEGTDSVTGKHYMRTSRLRNKILDEMALKNYSDTMRTEYNRN